MINKRYIIFGVSVTVFLLLIFLFYKYKQYPEYLVVVPNSKVTTFIRPKRWYKFITTGIPYDTFNLSTIQNKTPVTLLDYSKGVILTDNSVTNTVPEPSSVATGTPATDLSVHIYNLGPKTLNIIGVLLYTTYLNNTPTNNLLYTVGPRGGTPKEYDAGKLTLEVDNQISITNINEFILNRLTFICDNLDNQSVFIYLQNTTNNTISGIKISNITKDFIIIDFYK
jgi:hypothetical protein